MNFSLLLRPSLSANLGARLKPLRVLAVNAGAVALSSLGSAALGFAYWWIAARRFSPEAVGLAASAVSVMNLLAQIGEFGLGPLLLSEAPRHARAGSLIAASIAVAVACSLILAIGYAVGVRLALPNSGAIFQSAPGLAVFIAGTALTGATVVLDQALIALLRSELQAVRLGSFAVLKLLMLAAVAWLAREDATATTIFATWAAGCLASIFVLALVGARRGQRAWRRPQLSLLQPIMGKMLGHHVLNVALQAPTLMLPFLVTEMLSARVNAAFYAAWAIVGVVALAPASLSSVVVTVARREPGAFASRLAFSLGVSLAICGFASLAFWLFSPIILGLFNPQYRAIAGSSLAVLGIGTLGLAVKYHYIALARFTDRMGSATVAVALGGAAELALSIYGARTGGLDGLARGWVIASCGEAAAMGALMFSAAGGLARVRGRREGELGNAANAAE